jgi:hypothetical protein
MIIVFLNVFDNLVDNQKTNDSNKILPVKTLTLNQEKIYQLRLNN